MHRAPVAQLPGARTEHERVSLFVCVHQLAHVPRIARAVAGEKNVGARLRHGGHEKIDRALATVAIAALRCLGTKTPRARAISAVLSDEPLTPTATTNFSELITASSSS